ncbi:hypothetical protein K4B79_00655 [Streptomyces lincolnensis]|uniref:hypothetical protein n=1 Tax=Streptomyces lincolnensis TaxID=1915 RepID=UPI001E3D56D8|nr:hypothetical protein [Streptomyces lincolnensis]MCD7436725.1 hypothetical protein [Streptomyces lincolnensis]
MSTPPSLRYQHGTDAEFARRAAATFTLEHFDSALVLFGPCPRCGQQMTFTVIEELFRSADGAAPVPARPVVMYCTAETVYEGSPDGHTGCGAFWSLLLPSGAEA